MSTVSAAASPGPVLSIDLAADEVTAFKQTIGASQAFLTQIALELAANNQASVTWNQLALLRQVVDTFSDAASDQAAAQSLLAKLKAPLSSVTPSDSGGGKIIIFQ
jgi:hypothetical protein